jgi:catalase
VLVADGVDVSVLARLQKSAKGAGVTVEIIAPHVGGVEAADGTWIDAAEKLDGAPSVLYDAVALLMPAAAAKKLATASVARDFVADAFAHCKFIGYAPGAVALIDGAIGKREHDDGIVELGSAAGVTDFLNACGALRVWSREAALQIPAN